MTLNFLSSTKWRNLGAKDTLADLIDIKLESKDTDTFKSIDLDWKLIDFEPTLARLQLNTEKLQTDSEGDTLTNLKVTIRDSEGIISSESGLQLNAVETVSFEIAGLVDSKTSQSLNVLSTLTLAILGLAFSISFVLALFKGSLVSAWMFINTM